MNEYENDKEIIETLETMIEQVIDIEMQYDVYCQMMKEMFLAGSTNN